jgi:CHASE2 domain-containing sensor protein
MSKILLEFDYSNTQEISAWLRILISEQQTKGRLPHPVELYQVYTDWQATYYAITQGRIKFQSKLTPTEIREVQLRPKMQNLQNLMNQWLEGSDGFQEIRAELRSQLDRARDKGQEVRILLQTKQQSNLRNLPWSVWQLVDRYENAEIAISSSSYEKPQQQAIKGRLKILVVLGDSAGIDIEADRKLFQQLPGNPHVHFLKEPSRQEFSQCLWEHAWDILFFAGHSRTVDHSGLMYLNPNEEMPINDLSHGLTNAVRKGLKLAIFNSCDGMGFVEALEKAEVNIPQMIVMREPVPDRVAQEFLRYFLAAFSGGSVSSSKQRLRPHGKGIRRWINIVLKLLRSIFGISAIPQSSKTFYSAVKEARHRLQGLENEFPGASWLPVIYQNPAVEPPTWAELACRSVKPRMKVRGIVVLSLLITFLVMGLRMQGAMQPLELKAYDHLMRMRPIAEKPDPRLLVVTIDNNDIVDQGSEPGYGSLQDPTLFKLIQILEEKKPKVIGFDITRPDGITPPYQANLGKRLSSLQDPPLIFPCSWKTTVELGAKSPPQVPEHHVGFDNVPKDVDGVVRRYHLTSRPIETDSCQTPTSFGLLLALHYIAQTNPALEPSPSVDGHLKIGNQIFIRPDKFSGGYQNDFDVSKDTDQFILNYRPYHDFSNIAYSVRLDDVLKDRVPSEQIRGKIVLIGQNNNLQDIHSTPYSVQNNVPGIYIHAQAVSHILSAVLDNQKLIGWLPAWADCLWVWFWSVISCLFLQLVKDVPHQHNWLKLGSLVITNSAVYLLCQVAMWEALWFPLVPSLISILLSYIACYLLLDTLRRKQGS